MKTAGFVLPDETRQTEVAPDEFTVEQREHLRKLEAYPHEFFNLARTKISERSRKFYNDCFVCIAGATDYETDYSKLLDLAGEWNSQSRRVMSDLIGPLYGRDVPVVQGYPVDRLPKRVGIDAVKAIFRMGNAERAL